jgi:tryptophanyl-tRNA synthetase
MTQFKDKAGKNTENVSLGLLAYPALMAADILTYQATAVPVGEDQKQHLELTRDIAAKFNHDYGVEQFPITEPLIEGVATRVMSLRDGSKKMSKSDPSDASRINLTDDADAIAQKIRKARTDADPLPGSMDGLKDRPEAKNLVNIYAALADQTPDQVLSQFEGQGFGAFKPALAELAVASLEPITQRMNDYLADPAEIDRILGKGAIRADEIATPILERTKQIMGLLRTRS